MVKCEAREGDAALTLTLTGNADIANIHELSKQLKDALALGCEVVIDLDGLGALDGAGVQLLIAVKLFLERNGGRLRLVVSGGPALASLDLANALEFFGVG